MCANLVNSSLVLLSLLLMLLVPENVQVPFCLKSLLNSLTTITPQTDLLHTVSPTTSLSKHYTDGLFQCAKLRAIVSFCTSHSTRECEILSFLFLIHCCLSSLSAIVSQIFNVFLSLFLLITRFSAE